jgi:hypothetical protein
MADGFIIRRGGKGSEQALAPTITEVSTTQTSITFTITNNDASTAVILYEIGDATPDENSIELATGVTSDSIEITGLDDGTEYTVSATASVTGKVLSNVTSLAIETDALIYTAATGGTTEEYESGGKRYKSHTFTSNGTFEVTTVGDATDDRNKVDYLIIAGGGGGGFQNSAGGGGAGGYRTTFGTQGGLGTLDSKVTVTETSYSITIGAGGSGSTTNNSLQPGVNSSALGITSNGGGGGNGGSNIGGSGGSGGGSGWEQTTTRGTGISNQGFNSGLGSGESDAALQAGGGGGAGEIGSDGSFTLGERGGNGGDGLSSIIRTGASEVRGGGGGAGQDSFNNRNLFGFGGSGGGADGNTFDVFNNGTVNTGGGGGGGAQGSAGGSEQSGGGNGGSGIVVIRYEIAPSV